VAIALATLGLASTAITIVLCVIPGSEETNKPLAVVKVLGATLVLVGAGVAVFVVEKMRARKIAVAA
jgi:phenylacetate-coenzyme A ligase PaaK-like adenylate-forming protein